MRKRFRRATLGKLPVKHSSTLLDNTGPSVGSFFGHVIYETTAGARLLSGGAQTLKDLASNEKFVNVGDLIKYVNICLEASPRGAIPAQELDNAGWLEWAVIFQQENTVLPSVANIGVLTLGCIASHFYRENCIMTGCFPIGTKQAMSQDIKLKLPRKCCNIKVGYRLVCICYIRTSNSADVRTDSHRLIASSHFKCYS